MSRVAGAYFLSNSHIQPTENTHPCILQEDDLDFVQWGHIDAICVVVGRDEVLYSKSISLQVIPLVFM